MFYVGIINAFTSFCSNLIQLFTLIGINYQMTEKQLISASNKIKPYYPPCINEAATNKKNAIQLSIIRKILTLIYRKQRISQEMFQCISSFLFRSPIRLAYPIYQKVRNSEIDYGIFLLYDKVNEKTLKIQIKKFWKKLEDLEMTKDKTMRFAVHFDDFMELKNYIVSDQSELNEEKWVIVSENNVQFRRVFQVINKYKKDGIINENVISAFNKIMSRNILIVTLHQNQQYIVIDSKQKKLQNYLSLGQKSTSIALQYQPLKKKAHLGFNFEGQKMKLVSDSFQVYAMTDEISNRNEQTFLDSQIFREVTISDIYVNQQKI